MIIIGICGRSGSGKSTVGSIIKEKFSSYVDCDVISREVTSKGSECLSRLVAEFGDEILFEDGSLNRGKLGSIAFGNEEKIKALNSITHKYIIEKISLIIDEFDLLGEKVVFLDAPTLFESGLDKRCDYILSVFADEEKLIQRIKLRDGKTEEEARKRLLSQHDNEFLKTKSDFVIINNGSVEDLINSTKIFIKKVEAIL